MYRAFRDKCRQSRIRRNVVCLRQVLPGEAGLEDEDDPGEDLAIVEEGAPALGLRRMRWDEGPDQFPKFVREEGLALGWARSIRSSRATSAQTGVGLNSPSSLMRAA
jgi:hypothetical protein